jgi:hypothetical protein
MLLQEWQNTLKPISDLIVQASVKDGSDSWQPFPIGMSWEYVLNYKRGDILQIGSHKNLVLLAIEENTDQRRRPSGTNRKTIVSTLRNNHIYNSKLEHAIYFSQLPTYKFVISPEGNGVDCHRHYETLLAGAIHIIERNPLIQMKYNGCPILWTDDYSEITPEYLEKVYIEMLDQDYDFSSLFLKNYSETEQQTIRDCGNYWINRWSKSNWYSG